jgi:hypothetical protein
MPLDSDAAPWVMSADPLRQIASPLVGLLGSHGVTYANMWELGDAANRFELQQSREELRNA